MLDGVLRHEIRCPIGGGNWKQSHLRHFPQRDTHPKKVNGCIDELGQEEGNFAVVHRPER